MQHTAETVYVSFQGKGGEQSLPVKAENQACSAAAACPDGETGWPRRSLASGYSAALTTSHTSVHRAACAELPCPAPARVPCVTPGLPAAPPHALPFAVRGTNISTRIDYRHLNLLVFLVITTIAAACLACLTRLAGSDGLALCRFRAIHSSSSYTRRISASSSVDTWRYPP